MLGKFQIIPITSLIDAPGSAWPWADVCRTFSVPVYTDPRYASFWKRLKPSCEININHMWGFWVNSHVDGESPYAIYRIMDWVEEQCPDPAWVIEDLCRIKMTDYNHFVYIPLAFSSQESAMAFRLAWT